MSRFLRTPGARGWARSLVALGAVSVLMACSGLEPSPSASPRPPLGAATGDAASAPRAIAPVSVERLGRAVGEPACAVGSRPNAAGTCEPCPDYEGCFSSATQMQYFANVVITWISEYSAATYVALPPPDRWLYVPTGMTGEEACVDANGGTASYSDLSYEYCPSDETVYLGERSMWQYYSAMGDAAPAVGIAHEWGHHVQRVAGQVIRRDYRQQDTIASELQADCVAGSWSAYMRGRGILNDDDLADTDALMVDIAQMGPDRTHGTLRERTDAFLLGFRSGIASCNSFFPDTPLITYAP